MESFYIGVEKNCFFRYLSLSNSKNKITLLFDEHFPADDYEHGGEYGRFDF